MNPDVLKERYHLLCEKNSDIGEFLPTLVQEVDELYNGHYIDIIELGVRYGASTIAWLYALSNKIGRLWSVDCSFPIIDPETQIELLNPQGPLGVVDYWTFILGYDTWPVMNELLPGAVEIAFIDTNHIYEETLVELDLCAKRVRAGGRIILHDTFLETTGNAVTPQPPYPVRTAVNEWASMNCGIHNVRFIDSGVGLGIIQL